MKKTLPLLFLSSSLFLASCGDNIAYKNPDLAIEERVEDLVGRMTTAEKAAQLDMLRAPHVLLDYENFDSAKIAKYVDSMMIGSIHDFYPKSATLSNNLQKRAIENSRLGIPLIFIEEALHGYSGRGSTTFPVPIGNASTWDTMMLKEMGHAVARETRAHGVHFVLAPNLDLAREIRWGRVEETFGEDPYLAARMGVNLIKGMQGDDLSADDAIAAEPKHFAVHGIPENGHNTAPPYIGEREARATHLYAFEKAVKEANARGIMASYNEIDGVPAAGSHWLLTDVLRGEWDFDGFVVSDLGAIAKQLNTHKTVGTIKEAVTASVNAGLNMQFYDFSYEDFQNSILEGVEDGTIKMEQLDRMVADVLRVKFELGLFDNPYTDTTLVAKRHRSPENQKLAYDMALSSITLLKNEDNTLPFSNDVKSIALVGNLANVSALGGYSPAGAVGVTVFEALRKRFGNDVKINVVEGNLSSGFANLPAGVLFETPSSKKNGLKLEFFNNENLEGKPAYTTTTTELTSYWHNLSPAPGVDTDHFSARWSGYVNVAVAGEYEFALRAEDYGRLYINGKLLLDNWTKEDHDRQKTAKVNLKKGMNSFTMEYGEVEQFAGIVCHWRLVEMDSRATIFDDITRVARASDVVIVVTGESMAEVGEGKDKANLSISPYYQKVVEAAIKGGKPTATVLMNGRPLIIPELEAVSTALVEAWFPGESGGDAICDVLFGDYNPSGHLPISFPRNQDMLPSYYSRKPSSQRTYVDGNGQDVLYGFGHGLSYTTFEYSNLTIVQNGDNYEVSLDVKNTGKRDGADVVQLYLNDVVSSVTTPVMELKGFSKVFLKAGETKRVSMTLAPEHFSLVNIDMRRVVEPGDFEVMIGHSSKDIVLKDTITLK